MLHRNAAGALRERKVGRCRTKPSSPDVSRTLSLDARERRDHFWVKP
jgi:hypothetical protein